MQKNSLFNYFKKIEKPKLVDETESGESKKVNVDDRPDTTKVENKDKNKFTRVASSDDNDEEIGTSKKATRAKDIVQNKTPKSTPKENGRKRRRIIESSSDEEDTKVSEENDLSIAKLSEFAKRPRMNEISPIKIDDHKENSLSKSNSEVKTPSSSIKSSNNVFSVNKKSEAASADIGKPTWEHLQYDFLMPENIKDNKRRKMSDENYDPTTLFVPEKYSKGLTPGLRQWWEFKSEYFDCVIFMKVGKFYELYHMDAVIGVKELNLAYMNNLKVAHAGFPEVAYSRFARVLVDKGYKVARVEQTETPEMMRVRCKETNAKTDKVVKREVCQVTTKGTRMYLPIEGEATSSDNSYLLALAEQDKRYGVSFVDTSMGKFYLLEFDDDRYKSTLRTLLAHNSPDHVVVNKISKETQALIQDMCNAPIIDKMPALFKPGKQAISQLLSSEYFNTEDGSFPPGLNDLIDEGFMPKQGCELAISALGACLSYLERCKVDTLVASTGDFQWYSAPHLLTSTVRHMVLDSDTLEHLEVIKNQYGKRECTLFSKLDNCGTAFGKRLLKKWLCAPLFRVEEIKKRQDAVNELISMSDECDKARKLLKTIPDIERVLLKVSAYGDACSAVKHPDSRAIFYEDLSKKHVANLIKIYKALSDSGQIFKIFEGSQSELLKDITSVGKVLPDYQSKLNKLEEKYSFKDAVTSGKIVSLVPEDDNDLQNVQMQIKNIHDELNSYLNSMKKTMKVYDIKYVGSDRKRFQIEVPIKSISKVPSYFMLNSSKKSAKTYYTTEIKEQLDNLLEAEQREKRLLTIQRRKAFAAFSADRNTWLAVMQCLATLDVLLAMSKYSMSQATCVPVFVEQTSDQKSFIKVLNGIQPSTNVVNFIPNDTIIGLDDITLLLLTGPNMGGKSTVMRQISLIAILAQMGCNVPADACSLTPIDRIFTRIGGKDNIIEGESTFFVEMSEAGSILKHASPSSLVLMDELGRGTSTFDGAALAYAVIGKLLELRCLTFFTTHYHFLIDKFKNTPQIGLVHMACVTEECPDSSIPKVTFLYKLIPGSCPSSHGFNTARLAGLPRDIINLAVTKATQLQHLPMKIKAFLIFMTSKDALSLIHAIKKWRKTSAKLSTNNYMY